MLFSFLLAAGICGLFFVSFESRRPALRDIMPVIIICTLASAGRVIFGFLPQVQPVTAIVIITGICYGRQTGFLTGALCALAVSYTHLDVYKRQAVNRPSVSLFAEHIQAVADFEEQPPFWSVPGKGSFFFLFRTQKSRYEGIGFSMHLAA